MAVYISFQARSRTNTNLGLNRENPSELMVLGQFSGILICVAFNMPNLVWSGHLPHSRLNHSNDEALIECIIDLGLYQYVDFPIFTRANTILDLVFVDCENRILNENKEQVMGEINHGHFSLLWVYYFNRKKQRTVLKRKKLNNRKGNCLEINEHLKRIYWVTLFRSKDKNKIYSTFADTCLLTSKTFYWISEWIKINFKIPWRTMWTTIRLKKKNETHQELWVEIGR